MKRNIFKSSKILIIILMFIATLGIVACGGGGGSKNPAGASDSGDKSDIGGENGGGSIVSNVKLSGVWKNSVDRIEMCGNNFVNAKYIFYSNGKVSLYSTAREETYGNTLCLQVDGYYKYNESKNSISLSGMKSKVWFPMGDTLETKNYNETEYKIANCDSSKLTISCVPEGRKEEKKYTLTKTYDLVKGSDLKAKIIGLWTNGSKQLIYFNSDTHYYALTESRELSETKFVDMISAKDEYYSLNNEIFNFENINYAVTKIDDKELHGETLNNSINFKRTDNQPVAISKDKLYGAWKKESNESETGVDLIFSPTGDFKWTGDDFNESGYGTFDIENNVIVCKNSSNFRTLNWIPVAVDKDSITLYTSMEKTRYVKIKGIDIVAFAGGKGTASEPYLIETAEQLDSIRYYTDKCFKQTKDIDVGAYLSKRSDSNKYPSWLSNGREGWIPIDFSGNYDGNYKKITGYYSLNAQNGGGLFGRIKSENRYLYTNKCYLRNILLYFDSKGINIGKYNIGSYVGGLVNNASDMDIENCFVCGDIVSEYNIGGIVGDGSLSEIRNCCFVGNLQGGSCVGGIASDLYGSVTNCITSGNFKGSHVGGIYSYYFNSAPSIDKCYTTATMEGDDIYGISTGNEEVTNCAVITPKLSGKNIYAVGEDSSSYKIKNCYYCIPAEVEITKSRYESSCKSITKSSLWGASTKNSFWQSADFLNWTDFDENWEFRSGYNLPQLKNLPSVKDPSL